MNDTDTLVVGQGIAGSLVAYLLYQQGVSFKVVDPGHANTSSRIAAGMFTPVTGKRKTIDPLVTEQIELALDIYKSIGELLGTTILHTQHVYQVFHSAAEKESVVSKSDQPAFKQYLLPNPAPIPFLKHPDGACEITHSGWVDCETWLTGFASWLQQKQRLMQETFDYAALQLNDQGFSYKGLNFKHLICCEGYQAKANPFFTEELIIPCKGNVLTIRCDELQTSKIIKKHGAYLVPVGNHIFKVGSTYQWNDDTHHPDSASKAILMEKLDDILLVPYTVLDQKAATRPTTQDRQVIAKQHPVFKRIFMLNGLGTKGILQAPWWASHLLKLYNSFEG